MGVLRRLCLLGGVLILAFVIDGAQCEAAAHLASDSYLRIEIAGDGRVSGQWDIALRDLDVAVGLDANADGKITWGELKARRGAVQTYAASHLTLDGPGGACALSISDLMVDDHAGYGYAVLPFTADCPAVGGALTLGYSLLFDIDPTHRGLLTVVGNGRVETAVLTPDHHTVALEARPQSFLRRADRFLAFGYDHILLGYDHLLFVTVLLVTASLRRRDGPGWRPVDGFGRVMLEALKTLTAFTIAHAITLTLAVLGVIDVPSRLVDPAVALTIIIAAADNVWPILPRLRWHTAFVFGLVHGLAFAGVLGPMHLPPADLAVALGCFNLGVEAGQASLALLIVPIAYIARREVAYRVAVAPAVSIVALLLAGIWLTDRVFALDILSLTNLAANASVP